MSYQALPKFLTQVVSAIKNMQEWRRGSTPRAIINYICWLQKDIPRHIIHRQVLTALKRATMYGIIGERNGYYSLLPMEAECLDMANEELGLLNLNCTKRKHEERKRKKSGRSCECKSKTKRKKSKGKHCRSSASRKRGRTRKKSKSRSKYDCGTRKRSKRHRCGSRKRKGKKRGRGKKRACTCPSKSGERKIEGRDDSRATRKEGTKCAMNFDEYHLAAKHSPSSSS